MPHEIGSIQADADLISRHSLDTISLSERPVQSALSRHGTRLTSRSRVSLEEGVHRPSSIASRIKPVGTHDELVLDAHASSTNLSETIKQLHKSATTNQTIDDFLNRFPDGGYGWFVVLSSFLVNFTAFGYIYTWGIYQALYLDQIYVDRINTSQITFVGSLCTALLFAMGPFFGVLNRTFGFRVLMCAGTIIQPLGLLLASWVNSPWQLYFTHGVLVGIGSSLVFFPATFLPTQWFMRRRGLATGIAVSGSGIGGLVYGPVTRALIDALGFRGCLRCVAAGSFVLFLIATILTRECEATKKPAETQSITSQSKVKKPKIVDISILKRPEFIAMALMSTIATFGYFVPFYFLPAYSTFIDLTKSDGALFVGLSTGLNALGRVCLGYAADTLGRINTLFSCLFISGLTVIIWMFAESYGVLLLFVLLYGFSAGGFISLFPVVTADLVSLEELPNAIGVLYTSSALGNLVGPVIAGILLDSTAPDTSYLPLQLFCCLTTILSSPSILWLRFLRTRKIFVRV